MPGLEFASKEEFYLDALPLLFPVPSFDCHVIAPAQDDVCSRMHSKTSNVVRMCLKCSDLLVGIVIEHAYLEVVGPRDEPALASDESTAPHWDLRDFESFYQCTCLMVVYVDRAIIETS